MKTQITLLTLVLAAAALPVARADLLDNVIVDIRLGVRQPPPPPAVVVVVEPERHGPEQWEQRSHWYHSNQAYFYYPGTDVYYRQADHVWFYQDHGQWRSGRRLPDGIRIDFNRSVALNMYTDKPYTYHQQVVSRYPANYFGARVRLREDDRRNDKGPHGNDHDERDKDNGNRR